MERGRGMKTKDAHTSSRETRDIASQKIKDTDQTTGLNHEYLGAVEKKFGKTYTNAVPEQTAEETQTARASLPLPNLRIAGDRPELNQTAKGSQGSQSHSTDSSVTFTNSVNDKPAYIIDTSYGVSYQLPKLLNDKSPTEFLQTNESPRSYLDLNSSSNSVPDHEVKTDQNAQINSVSWGAKLTSLTSGERTVPIGTGNNVSDQLSKFLRDTNPAVVLHPNGTDLAPLRVKNSPAEHGKSEASIGISSLSLISKYPGLKGEIDDLTSNMRNSIEKKEIKYAALSVDLENAQENLSPFVKKALSRFSAGTDMKVLVDYAESCYEFNETERHWQVDSTSKRLGEAYRAQSKFLQENPEFDIVKKSHDISSFSSAYDLVSKTWSQISRYLSGSKSSRFSDVPN